MIIFIVLIALNLLYCYIRSGQWAGDLDRLIKHFSEKK